ALVLLFIFGIKGCNGVGTGAPASSSPSQIASLGKLYIANAGDGDLLFYDQAVRAYGNASPSRRLAAGLTGPVGVFLDKSNDRLYVANVDQNAILIFEGVSQISSLSAPAPCSSPVSPPCLRILSGVNSQINRPYGLFVDTVNDRLYVANAEVGTSQVSNTKSGNILIFNGASGLNGDTAPSRSLGGPSTTLDFPRSLYVDTDRDLLYVSNSGHNSILLFANASTTDGEVPPVKIIQPPDVRTQDSTCSQDLSCLNLPFGILVDKTNDRLYVANTGLNQSSILIFKNASTRVATTPPDLVLTGNATLIADPVGLDLDAGTNTLYVTNQGDVTEKPAPLDQSDTITRIPLDSLVAFKDLIARCGSSVVCSNAPDQVVQGRNSGLADPAGVVVDAEKALVYVANASGNQVSAYGLTGNTSPAKLLASPTGLGGQIATMLNTPVGVFYDAANDRLYVANYNGVNNSPVLPALLVWEKASQIPFFSRTPPEPPCPQGTTCTQIQTDLPAQTPPTWWINAGGNLTQPIGVFADNSSNLLILLDAAPTGGRLVALDLSTLPPAPAGAVSLSESWAVTGLFKPRGLAVDAAQGNIYVSYDECLSPCSAPVGATPSSIEVRDITNG
ncbi:MAG TPA: hypothetical protein VFG95_04210, partial [Nitrospiria bacterium]|nr:hypothetical protein [Nitrospiria bacterium]